MLAASYGCWSILDGGCLSAGMESAFRLAGEAGLEVGLLRPERGLATPDDVRAARADPLFPPEIAALLRAVG